MQFSGALLYEKNLANEPLGLEGGRIPGGGAGNPTFDPQQGIPTP